MFAYSPFFLNIKTMDIINFLEQDASDILMLPFTFKEWQVKPLTVAQVIAINPILSKIVLDDIGDLESSLKDGKIENLISFQIKYAKQVNDVVTTIIGEDISSKVTNDEIMTLFLAILYRMGGKSFLKSINLIQKLSLQTRTELIAAQERMKKVSMTLPNS